MSRALITHTTIQLVDDSLKELWIIDKLLLHYGWSRQKYVSQCVCEALEQLKFYQEECHHLNDATLKTLDEQAGQLLFQFADQVKDL